MDKPGIPFPFLCSDDTARQIDSRTPNHVSSKLYA